MSEANNGRVTNAILSTKLDHLIDDVAEIKGLVSKVDDRVDEVEKAQVACGERWKAHQQMHQRERGLLAGASIVQSIVAGLAGIFVKPT